MGMVTASKQSLFNDKVIFPNLKELRIDLSEAVNEIFEITSSQSSSLIIFTFIPNLSKLSVTCTSRDKSIALLNVKLFLHKYHYIHTLELSSSFVDGYQQQQPDDGDELINTTTSTSCLMNLSIQNADRLNHVFGDPEYAQPSHTILFQNLKSLSVLSCSRLQSFAPSFMYFHKLETLSVSYCDGLTYLFSSSTTATLVQLKEMNTSNCKIMREVINRDYYNHDEKGQIEAETKHHHFVFRRLETLDLEDLLSLQSFYSGNKVMSFPNLEDLSLGNCLKMRRFSHVAINTSVSLKTIRVDYKVEILERDLNTTARKLWKETDDDDYQHCQENA